jgi:hypothetical protein
VTTARARSRTTRRSAAVVSPPQAGPCGASTAARSTPVRTPRRTAAPERNASSEVWASVRLPSRGSGQLPWSHGVLRGLRSGAAKAGVGVSAMPQGTTREASAGGGQVGWFFPAALQAFDRHRSGALEDVTGASQSSGEPLGFSTPWTVPISFEASAHGPGPSRSEPTRTEVPAEDQSPPLVRFVTCRPSTDTSNARPLPDRDPLGTRTGGSEEPWADGTTRPALVPTSWFRTTSPVFSARRTAGLLHPAAGPGVRRVSRNPLPRSRTRATRARIRCRGEAGLVPATR